MKNFSPYSIAIVSSLVGAVAGAGATALITNYLEKDDFSITTTSCTTKGPEKAYIRNVATGDRVEVPMSAIPSSVERITSITNTGKKPINGEDIHITIYNEIGAKTHNTIIFYESTLSKHELISDQEGQTFRIRLKNFNPHDTITVLVASDRQLGVGVESKGSGYTLKSRYKRDDGCGWFGTHSYGGAIAYSKVA